MADTITTVLTQEMTNLLSAEMLIQPDDLYLFYANGPIQRSDDMVRQPGSLAVLFNRPTLPTGTYTEASRRLVDGTVVSTTGIAIAETQVTLTVREYAGPHDGSNVAPFSISEFMKNRAKHNLVALIGEFLRRDRNRMLDVTISDLLLAATTVVTPSGATEATVAGGVTANVEWLRLMNKTMKDNLIPTFPNGRWRLIMDSTDEKALKGDTDYKEAARYLGTQNPLFPGHVMSFEGFDIMVNTMLSTKAVGVASAETGHQSVAFGPYGIGHGVAMEPNVRTADDKDYGRSEKVIWKSEEAIGTLYADMLVRGITTE